MMANGNLFMRKYSFLLIAWLALLSQAHSPGHAGNLKNVLALILEYHMQCMYTTARYRSITNTLNDTIVVSSLHSTHTMYFKWPSRCNKDSTAMMNFIMGLRPQMTFRFFALISLSCRNDGGGYK